MGLKSSSRTRIALYSPGMVGLGHMRRNLLVAQALARGEDTPTILMIAEAREASAYASAMPPMMDCVTLPALRKDADGRTESRYLDIALHDLVALRASTIRATLEAFAPDVLIVDHLPRGAMGEIDAALASLRADGRTRFVLGLRDVLEDPATVRREWDAAGNIAAIGAYYDAIWIYGDPAVYNAVREYDFPPGIAAKVRFTGYLDQCLRLGPDAAGCQPLAALGLPPGRLVVCEVGGGQDGHQLAEAFVSADLPPDVNAVIVTGPFMPLDVRQRLHRHAVGHPRLRVLDFHPEPTVLVREADYVIGTGGYNTVAEVLSFEKRALIVPRAGLRREQAIRAERLRVLGLIDVLELDQVSPRAIGDWIAAGHPAPRPARERVDLNSTARLPRLLRDLLAAEREAALPDESHSAQDALEQRHGAYARL